MTAIEDEILRDQNERNGLDRAVADAETAVAVSAPGTRRILEDFVENAKKRLTTLDKKINDAVQERDVEVRTQAATIALLAEKEAALSQSEKRAYSGFLEKEFFTKHDFKSLEQFYSGPYDRLSEGGKEEMSHRVWEGIRHGEYRFTELPKDVQEKEEKFLHAKLTTSSIQQSSLNQIPETDRTDFIRAYEAGNRKEAGEVLNRDGFRRNVALDTPRDVDHKMVDDGKKVDNPATVSNVMRKPEKAVSPAVKSTAAADFSNIVLDSSKLDGVTLADATSPPSSASLPDASGSRGKVRG